MNKPLKPGKLLFITGTGTGVGKTVITAGLLAVFNKKGYRTIAIKTFQTGIEAQAGQLQLQSPDVRFYREAGSPEEPEAILNPVALGPPAAPWVAAILEQTSIDLAKVYGALKEVLARYDLVILEGAGGLCVPIAKNFLMADFIKELKCPALIVAGNYLGTINHTLLTVSYAQAHGIPVSGVVVNGLKQDADQVAALNPWVIKELSGVPLLGVVPYSPEINVDAGIKGNLVELIEEAVDLSRLEADIFGTS